jgi:hypothetical protein
LNGSIIVLNSIKEVYIKKTDIIIPMVDIHKTVVNLYQDHQDELEIFECEDAFSDTQAFVIIMVIKLRIPVMRY